MPDKEERMRLHFVPSTSAEREDGPAVGGGEGGGGSFRAVLCGPDFIEQIPEKCLPVLVNTVLDRAGVLF